MDAIESANVTMAMRSLDIAVDDLKDLLDGANFPPEDPDPDRPEKICSYTRIVHTIVWRDREPASSVSYDVIPRLQEAEDKIGEIKKEATLSNDKEFAEELKHYMENVRLRRENLEFRYLKGLSTNFAWDEIEPRLKTMSS